MGLVITTYDTYLYVDLGGLSKDRMDAYIKYSDIRSLTRCTDGASVEIVFSNGEIQGFPYTSVDEVDGVTPTSQEHLRDLIKTKIIG